MYQDVLKKCTASSKSSNERMANPGLNVKLVILGDSGVGKTTLIHRYVDSEFRADFKATIGADFNSKQITVNEDVVDLHIWDTAGEERFHSVGATFYRGTDACVLVYDVTQRESFNRLKTWEDDMFAKSGIDRLGFPIIVFGNKADLDEQRQVSFEEGQHYGKQWGVPVLEVSAKSGVNLEEGFTKLVEMYLQQTHERKKAQQPICLNINQASTGKKKCDC